MFSSFGRSCGSTRLATRLDSYHSSGINLNISLTTVKQTIETTNCQTLCNSGHMKRGDYCLYKPQEFRSTGKLEEEDEYLVPSLSFGNRGKLQTLSTNSHIKHPTVCQKLLEPNDKDTTLDTTMINDITKEPQTCYSDRIQFSKMLSEELSPSNPRKGTILVDEPQLLHDPSIRLPLKRKSCQENITYKDGTKKTWTLLGDDDNIDTGTHEVLASTKKNEDHGSVHLKDAGKIGDILETKFLSSNNITPEEVKEMIGPEQYCRARRTIIQ